MLRNFLRYALLHKLQLLTNICQLNERLAWLSSSDSADAKGASLSPSIIMLLCMLFTAELTCSFDWRHRSSCLYALFTLSAWCLAYFALLTKDEAVKADAKKRKEGLVQGQIHDMPEEDEEDENEDEEVKEEQRKRLLDFAKKRERDKQNNTTKGQQVQLPFRVWRLLKGRGLVSLR